MADDAVIRVDARALAKALRRVRHAIAHDTDRPILETVRLEVEGQALLIVASDDVRVAEASIPLDGAEEFAANIHRDDLAAVIPFLRASDGDITITATGVGAVFDGVGRSLAVRKPYGAWPDHRPPFAEPATAPAAVAINPAYLRSALKACRGKSVDLRLCDPDRPIILTVDGYHEAIMPMRSRVRSASVPQ